MTEPATTPRPGSAEAIAQGCTCPVIDNRDGIVTREDCLLHGEQVPQATETAEPAP